MLQGFIIQQVAEFCWVADMTRYMVRSRVKMLDMNDARE